MNGVLLAWVLEKAWEIDMKVILIESLLGNGTEFENDSRLNREPVNRLQEWHRMRNRRRPCDNP